LLAYLQLRQDFSELLVGSVKVVLAIELERVLFVLGRPARDKATAWCATGSAEVASCALWLQRLLLVLLVLLKERKKRH
jgi:hypothetical protein